MKTEDKRYLRLNSQPATPWSRDDECLTCIQIRPETHDVKTFLFAPESERCFRFRPGQYMTFALPIDGRIVYRCYTISSPPTRPDTLSITVKRVPHGPASNWLHDHLQPGMRLSANGPGGEFSCFREGVYGRKLLLISGGSGITPMMSMAKAFHDLGQDIDLTFLHAARTPIDIIFEDVLRVMSRDLPSMRMGFICESRGPVPAYAGMLGRLNLTLLESVVPDFAEREVYCCGPAPFMLAVRSMLMTAGYNMLNYQEESFSFEKTEGETPPASAAEVSPENSFEVTSFEVTMSKRNVVFRCRSDQTILQAALEAGLRMPSSCTQGVCGTCRTVKLSGELDMQQQGALRPREVKQGWVLPCCSKPLSNVVLDA